MGSPIDAALALLKQCYLGLRRDQMDACVVKV
jgi:hypothetical protein